MIQTIQETIIDRLEEITGVTVTAWQGDIDEILDSPLTLPCIQVMYQAAAFGPRKTMGMKQWDSQMEFLIIVVGKDTSDRLAAAGQCYSIIESVRDKLAGHEITGYGALEPLKEERLLSVGGVVMYGLTYSLEVVVTIT